MQGYNQRRNYEQNWQIPGKQVVKSTTLAIVLKLTINVKTVRSNFLKTSFEDYILSLQ